MGIVRVSHGQFMRCPSCRLLFLVSDKVGGSKVWHPGCGAELEIVYDVSGWSTAILSMVVLERERSRLEVVPGLGVV
jgi:hypothetical protein